MLPLDGIRVLDCTRVLAGPLCAMLLGDLGADVIKVEQPGRGDETRAWGPPFVGGESTYFWAANRNKRSLTLDLGRDVGRAIFTRLLERSDVLVENFKAGTLERWGFDEPALRRINPRLVHTAITAYGPDGPRARASRRSSRCPPWSRACRRSMSTPWLYTREPTFVSAGERRF